MNYVDSGDATEFHDHTRRTTGSIAWHCGSKRTSRIGRRKECPYFAECREQKVGLLTPVTFSWEKSKQQIWARKKKSEQAFVMFLIYHYITVWLTLQVL